MTVAVSQRPVSSLADPNIQKVPRKSARLHLRVLAVVDDTEQTNRVTNYILSAFDPRNTEVVVLNVQEKRDDARLRGYQTFKQAEIDDRLITDIGLPIVNSVTRLLEKSGMPSRSKVLIGEWLPTVLKCAAEERCSIIVVAEERPTGFVGRVLSRLAHTMFRSPAAMLADRARVPIVVAK
jgi:hypothetical protein